MTASELIERAKRQLNAPDLEINLAACVMQASGRLARKVMRDDALRPLLQQVYSVTLSAAGEGDLLAATGSITGNAGEILIDGIRLGVVVDADGNILQPLLHYHDFLRPQATQYAYYNLKDRKILTRAIDQQVNVPSDVVGVNGPLSITASFDPQEVTDYPAELEDHLVQELCDVVMPANATAR